MMHLDDWNGCVAVCQRLCVVGAHDGACGVLLLTLTRRRRLDGPESRPRVEVGRGVIEKVTLLLRGIAGRRVTCG
jgi:hypothetical protein